MKKIAYILFASVMILTGCTEDFELNDNEQGLSAEFLLGKYVAFAAPGANTTVDPEEVDEAEGDTVDLTVEIPSGSVSDVTVNYTLSGTAVFGTDYTIAGATSAGGSVTIVHDPDAPDAANVFDNVDIEIEILKDGVGDGEKTVVVTLTSASNAQGEVLVGRAGTDLLISHSVIISDIDYVTVTADPTTVNENAGMAKFVFEANPAADRTDAVDVEYSLSGTAEFGVDYTIAGATADGGTITIPVGDPMEFELDVEILTDSAEDGEKTIIATLVSANDGAALSLGVGGSDTDNSATITINDASNSVIFSTDSEDIEAEENDGTVNVTLELHAGDDMLSDVTVDYTLGGTAVFGVDYTIAGATADGGSVVITPNNPPTGMPTTLNLPVQLLTDAVSDGEKTIVINITKAALADDTELSAGVDGTGATATITVSDVDFATVAEDSVEVEVTENAGTATVTLEALTGVDIYFNYSLGGTAVYGVDYIITGATSSGGSGTITTNGGVVTPSTFDLDIQILTDGVADGDKTIVVTIDEATQADGTPFTVVESTSTITIEDVDVAP